MAAPKASASSNSRTTPSDSPRIEWAPIRRFGPIQKTRERIRKSRSGRSPRAYRQFGFLNPVLVDDDNMVLAGHGRLEAARLEGLTHVPILRFGHLTEAQKRAYVIADNRIAE